NEIRIAIEAYGRGQARCSVTAQSCVQNSDCPANETCFTSGPELAAGSFLPGFTTSRWPSWTAELGKALGLELPNDPLNTFGGACVTNATANAKYDQQTCWNQEEGKYAAASGSYLYEYARTPTGTWAVRGGFEYADVDAGDPDVIQPEIAGQRLPTTMGITEGGVPTAVRVAGGRCGDGALSSGEQCDPPGTTGIPTGQSATCTTGVPTGSQFWTCEQDCTWSATPSACGALCGNFVINGTEQCDVGPRGGRVPAGHPTAGTIPGVSTSTQYACSTTCAWSGGRCGDTTLQSAYGEQCDGTRNVATTPAGSSASTQYGCTPVTDPNPCKATGGFCGDGTVQAAKGEQCEGDESRSCFDGAFTFSQTLPWRATSNVTVGSLFTMRTQAVSGSVRLVLVTSNSGRDLSAMTRDQIEAALSGGKTINDYNPRGAQGGLGIYHRIRVEVCTAGGGAPCVAPDEPLWALASTTQQTNTIVIDGVTSGAHMLKLSWDNDWHDAPNDSNLGIHEVRLEGDQVRSCGSPGATSACQAGSWQACRPAGALCGNGIVDETGGEQCDDGGKGRCTNDPLKVCTADTECGAGNACDRSADACTSDCRANTCGDSQQLAPTCATGDASNIGKPCRSNAECGRNGLCATEQCDLGTSNWRVGTPQCAASDTRCVDSATCPYGRTCNYCIVNSCSISTKQGGFCGDRAVNGPEVCDFQEGTNQCAGLSSAVCQSRTSVANLDWTREICNAACDAKCPDQYVNQNVVLVDAPPIPSARSSTAMGLNPTPSKEFNAGETKYARVQSCRLLGGLTFDVDIAGGVDIWPTPISVAIVTDRSGSMAWDAQGRVSTTVGYTPPPRIETARAALASSGGLLDKLKEVADGRAAVGGGAAGQVNVALVSYGNNTDETNANLTDIVTSIDSLKDTVNLYEANLGGTNTGKALGVAAGILEADTTARTKVIILMSDGAAGDMVLAQANSGAFKNPSANQFIFTIAFPGAITGMTEWSSGEGFHFAGDDLDAFYGEIAGKIAGAMITLRPFDGQGKCTNDATILCETDVVCGTGGTCDLCAGTPSQ
ncbi:MAG: vWA domain-containing protein, partial [bacterium]|nr:vWA domain-containing protein [bacterium]